MNRLLTRLATSAALVLSTLSVQAEAPAAGTLHIYNWSDYIAEDTISNFEKETGIKVVYDVYDSNEVLETKLLAGNSGYDLVFPTARPFADRHIKAKVYQALDKNALPNIKNIDSVILNSLADIDPNNTHLVPYTWGTTGIGYNVDKVKAILGNDMPLDTWKLVFDPKIASKLQGCGISLMDDATEVFAAASAYLGRKQDDFSKENLEAVAKVINDARPYIRYFHSSQYINDLANGDTCVSHGYSGDILQARSRAEEAKNGVNVAYAVPSEGAVVWTDVMAIPADAKNSKEAHQFINYLMRPEVMAAISNVVWYANANTAATALVDEAIRTDKGIYPPEETRSHFMVLKTPSDKAARVMNRLWTRIKTGQ